MPALSDQSQTDKVGPTINSCAASCRPIGQRERERAKESRLRFMVVLQLDPMDFIISLEIPRMFGDDRLCCEASFLKIVNQI